MKSKNIKFVDITSDDDTVINNNVVTVEDVLSETNEIAPVSTDIKEEEAKTVVNELKQTVKTTNLTECPKCHKMITNKTLKYSHAKTCGIVKQPPNISAVCHAAPTKDVRLCDNVIKQVTAIEQRNGVNKVDIYAKPRSFTPPKIEMQETTLEEIRHNYYINAKQQRMQKKSSLFANAI